MAGERVHIDCGTVVKGKEGGPVYSCPRCLCVVAPSSTTQDKSEVADTPPGFHWVAVG